MSATTGADGCVVFPNLPTGVVHTASLSAVDHVGLQGEPTPTSTFSLTAGKVTKVSMSYAPRAALSLTATPPQAGLPGARHPRDHRGRRQPRPEPPPGLRGLLDEHHRTAELRAGHAAARLRALPRRLRGVGRQVPRRAPGSPQSATAGTPAAAVTSSLGGVRLTLTPSGVTNLTGRRVYAEHAADAGCPGGVAHQLVTSTATELRLSLPIGTWVLVARNADMSEFTRSAAFTVTAGAVTDRTY